MAKKQRLDDYQLFFMEIPSPEQDLEDIQVIDVNEEEDANTQQVRGLSDEQVSRFVSDTMGQPKAQSQDSQPAKTQHQLFDN